MSEKVQREPEGLRRAALTQRLDALFRAMSSDYLLREQFVTDPAQITAEYVYGSRISPPRASLLNQLVYAVAANRALVEWMAGYFAGHRAQPPPARRFIRDFSRAVGQHGGHHVVMALMRGGSDEASILAGFDDTFVAALQSLFLSRISPEDEPETDSTAITDTTDSTDITDLTGITDITDITDLTGITDITDITDTTGVTDVTGTTEITSITDVTGITDTTRVTDITGVTDTTSITDIHTFNTSITSVTDTTLFTHLTEITTPSTFTSLTFTAVTDKTDFTNVTIPFTRDPTTTLTTIGSIGIPSYVSVVLAGLIEYAMRLANAGVLDVGWSEED